MASLPLRLPFNVDTLVFPKPPPSYTSRSFPNQLIFIPKPHDTRDTVVSHRANTSDHGGGAGGGGGGGDATSEGSSGEGATGDRIPCLFLRYPSARFVILFFHGNAEDVGRCYHFCNLLKEQFQVHVCAMEYPGYGIADGVPDENTVYAHSRIVFEYLRDVIEWPEDSIFIMGRSIGTGPAVYLGSLFGDAAGVILVSPFLSIKEVVRSNVGFVANFIKERFPNYKHIQKVRAPLLLIHGQSDTLIPYRHAVGLYTAIPSGTKKLLVTPKDMTHNSNLLQNIDYFVLPMLQFFPLPDYAFEDIQIPPECFHLPPTPLNKHPDGEDAEGDDKPALLADDKPDTDTQADTESENQNISSFSLGPAMQMGWTGWFNSGSKPPTPTHKGEADKPHYHQHDSERADRSVSPSTSAGEGAGSCGTNQDDENQTSDDGLSFDVENIDCIDDLIERSWSPDSRSGRHAAAGFLEQIDAFVQSTDSPLNNCVNGFASSSTVPIPRPLSPPPAAQTPPPSPPPIPTGAFSDPCVMTALTPEQTLPIAPYLPPVAYRADGGDPTVLKKSPMGVMSDDKWMAIGGGAGSDSSCVSFGTPLHSGSECFESDGQDGGGLVTLPSCMSAVSGSSSVQSMTPLPFSQRWPDEPSAAGDDESQKGSQPRSLFACGVCDTDKETDDGRAVTAYEVVVPGVSPVPVALPPASADGSPFVCHPNPVPMAIPPREVSPSPPPVPEEPPVDELHHSDQEDPPTPAKKVPAAMKDKAVDTQALGKVCDGDVVVNTAKGGKRKKGPKLKLRWGMRKRCASATDSPGGSTRRWSMSSILMRSRTTPNPPTSPIPALFAATVSPLSFRRFNRQQQRANTHTNTHTHTITQETTPTPRPAHTHRPPHTYSCNTYYALQRAPEEAPETARDRADMTGRSEYLRQGLERYLQVEGDEGDRTARNRFCRGG
ncbi:unnamed protein product [Vitrella brassicaformis CCMP3155]|uniref:Serine aminopeptidase S33 domain-containing protein n=2 Tax=Vitrella brassicaformis TaxID=1169539 RepID=A0A0G4F2B4_VITBC|nr:unnamed protein product [Vitrella brassicaformis CCMP3155]|eukprot:CEM05509.1 unnamed protein product [Vitrella brassicaformis CCMP3155]